MTDVMAAIANLTTIAQMTADTVGQVQTAVTGMQGDIAELKTGQAQLRADVAELKVEVGLVEARVDDAHRAILRHINDPRAHGHEAA